MLDVAATFLRDELNSYLARRTGSDTVQVQLSRIVDDAGKVSFSNDSLALTLINIEEDRVLRGQAPEYVIRDGQHVRAEPSLRLNLLFMISANFRSYDQALKYISYTLAFFQSQPSFRPETHPGMDGLSQLSMELQSLSYEQLNQLWAFIGAKQLPSIVYRARLVVLPTEASQTQAPVAALTTETGSL